MRRAIWVCVTLICCSSNSFASFNVKFNGTGHGLVGNVTLGGASIGNFFVGQLSFQHHYVSATNPGIQFDTFCIDLNGRITTSLVYQVTQEELSTFVPAANISRLAYLYDTYGDGVGVTPAPAGQDNKWFAALQLSFWSLTLSNPSTLGSSLLTGNTLTYYNTFMTESIPTVYMTPDYGGVDWLNRGPNPAAGFGVGQHLLYHPPENQPPEVPAPGALVLATTGGLFFGASRKLLNMRGRNS